MKFNLVILLSAALASTGGYAQTSGGTGAGATAGGGANGTGGDGTGASAGVNTSTSSSSGGASSTTSSSTSGGVRVNPPPGVTPPPSASPRPGLLPGGSPTVQNPNPNPNPTLPIREPFPPPGVKPQPGMPTNVIAKSPAMNTNLPLPGTNQAIFGANQSNTNQVGNEQSQTGTGTALTPTSQLGVTNRILSTNTAGITTNANPLLIRDQALSEGDRRLLYQIRAAVFGPNQATAPLAGTPVHFILKDGSVRLVGTVTSDQEKQRIEGLVQQVPGVVRVFDALQISQQGQVNQPGTQPPPQ